MVAATDKLGVKLAAINSGTMTGFLLMNAPFVIAAVLSRKSGFNLSI